MISSHHLDKLQNVPQTVVLELAEEIAELFAALPLENESYWQAVFTLKQLLITTSMSIYFDQSPQAFFKQAADELRNSYSSLTQKDNFQFLLDSLEKTSFLDSPDTKVNKIMAEDEELLKIIQNLVEQAEKAQKECDFTEASLTPLIKVSKLYQAAIDAFQKITTKEWDNYRKEIFKKAAITYFKLAQKYISCIKDYDSGAEKMNSAPTKNNLQNALKAFRAAIQYRQHSEDFAMPNPDRIDIKEKTKTAYFERDMICWFQNFHQFIEETLHYSYGKEILFDVNANPNLMLCVDFDDTFTKKYTYEIEEFEKSDGLNQENVSNNINSTIKELIQEALNKKIPVAICTNNNSTNPATATTEYKSGYQLVLHYLKNAFPDAYQQILIIGYKSEAHTKNYHIRCSTAYYGINPSQAILLDDNYDNVAAVNSFQEQIKDYRPLGLLVKNENLDELSRSVREIMDKPETLNEKKSAQPILMTESKMRDTLNKLCSSQLKHATKVSADSLNLFLQSRHFPNIYLPKEKLNNFLYNLISFQTTINKPRQLFFSNYPFDTQALRSSMRDVANKISKSPTVTKISHLKTIFQILFERIQPNSKEENSIKKISEIEISEIFSKMLLLARDPAYTKPKKTCKSKSKVTLAETPMKNFATFLF